VHRTACPPLKFICNLATTTTFDAMARNDAESRTASLPVFYFHCLTGNPTHAHGLETALKAQGRAVVALSFSPGEQSTESLHLQVPKAITQIRHVVASDERFQGGYVFIAHSQGGLIARAVIEEMDDHQVHTFISLAAIQNGIFLGPQREDEAVMNCVLSGFGAAVLPHDVFDFSEYRDGDRAIRRGKLQLDLARVVVNRPELQDKHSFLNLQIIPVKSVWLDGNSFLPVVNNINKLVPGDEKGALDQARRKTNFSRLRTAHFFASPDDGMVAPWQSSIFGAYRSFDQLEDIESAFESLTVLNMRETEEYLADTFGLRTLDERGVLFLHEVPGVHHLSWFADGSNLEASTTFQALFNKYISPSLP
jgi:palmitoyl-protein thioesterase